MADTRVSLPGFSAETLRNIPDVSGLDAIPRHFQHVPGMVYRAAYTPESIAAAALATGTARSAEYLAGLLDVLKLKLRGERIHCPYQAGTASFDAYFAGNRHGFDVYRAHQEQQGGCHD
jgi:hypothetical protein